MRKERPGIYCIVNKANEKKYIGSSKSVYYRWKGQHRCNLRRGVHKNIHLQNAWNKYGEHNFEFLILEECPIISLKEREEYWMETYKSYQREFGYNSSRLSNGNHIMSEEAKSKMKQVWQNPDYKLKRAIIMKETWKNKSEEIRCKMRKKWTDPEVRKKHVLSEAGRKKILEANKEYYLATTRAVTQFDLNGRFVKQWISPKEAIRVFGPHVSSVLTGKRKHTHNFIFRYTEDKV